MKLLITLDAVGGVWQYAMDLGRAARAAGDCVLFAGLGPAPTTAQRAEAAALGSLEWGDAPLDWMVPGRMALAGVPAWIDGLAARHRVDLLHLNLPSQAVGLRCGLPVVAVSHSCLATWFAVVRGDVPPRDRAWHARITAEGLATADVAVAPSAAHAALVGAVYGIRGLRVVPNASTAPARGWTVGRGVVAAARWWDAGKNGEILDDAASRCRAEVTMPGPTEGPGGARFTARHAHAPGAMGHADVLRRIAEAAMFVSPSVYEPFGLAALEAARASRPLVLADIPTYRELWGDVATFFDPVDPEALAATIDHLAADPDRRRRLGEAARVRAGSFSPEAQGKAMADIWRSVFQATAEAVG